MMGAIDGTYHTIKKPKDSLEVYFYFKKGGHKMLYLVLVGSHIQALVSFFFVI